MPVISYGTTSMNSRAKGRRNEAKAYRKLEAEGYHVEKMNAPHRMDRDGHVDFFNLFDLIAVDPTSGKSRFVQVKTNVLPPPAYRKRMSMFCLSRQHCSIELWVYYDRVKEPRVILL